MVRATIQRTSIESTGTAAPGEIISADTAIVSPAAAMRWVRRDTRTRSAPPGPGSAATG